MRMVLSNGFPHPQSNDQTDVDVLIDEAASRVLNIGGVKCVAYGIDLVVQFSDEVWMRTAQRRTGWQQAANDANALVAQLNCRDGAHAQILADGHAWSEFKVGNSGT